MPVKRKSSRKGPKLTRNVKINSKRASQKKKTTRRKRGRSGRKSQRGGDCNLCSSIVFEYLVNVLNTQIYSISKLAEYIAFPETCPDGFKEYDYLNSIIRLGITRKEGACFSSNNEYSKSGTLKLNTLPFFLSEKKKIIDDSQQKTEKTQIQTDIYRLLQVIFKQVQHTESPSNVIYLANNESGIKNEFIFEYCN